jgi:hypothetical protein
MGDQPVARPIPTPMILAFKRAKGVRSLDKAATEIGEENTTDSKSLITEYVIIIKYSRVQCWLT